MRSMGRWFACGLLLVAGVIQAADKPNIVFIFGDDLGIDAFSCYGSDRFKGQTPNIDKLAAGGIRFDQCYATPLCGPSRCRIMTGQYNFRSGGLSNQSAKDPSFMNSPSLAKVLKSAGYAVGMAGKWRQMSDTPGDWGFDEYITDPTAGGWFWKNSYFKNGEQINTDKEIYYPDLASDFCVDFIKRNKDKPFYFYLSDHLAHGPILKTPDTKAGATPEQIYDDNVKYLDKTVGKIVSALESLGLREKTLVLFSTDNGTATIGYQEHHDPKKSTGTIGGRHVHGHKGQLLEGGSRVPLVVSWPGKTPAGSVNRDLVDFVDLMPTFAELAGASVPSSPKTDGVSFAPQIQGQKGKPRDWLFMQLGNNWYVRDQEWKLTNTKELFSLKDAPFAEAPAGADAAAQAARTKLQAVLDNLNPGIGKVDPKEQVGDAAKKNKQERRAAKKKAAAVQKTT